MVEILAYAFGIMYTPGPANLLSLNAGLNGHVSSTLRFCLGVAFAMLLLFLLIGYTGSWLVGSSYQIVISGMGSIYIIYLAYKLAWNSHQPISTEISNSSKAIENKLSFKSGLIMQLLNPKAFIAILPIVTVQFPAAEISGSLILVWSLLLSGLAFGAPGCYLLMGARLGKLIQNSRYFCLLNRGMALLLLYVAMDIIYSQIYLKLINIG